MRKDDVLVKNGVLYIRDDFEGAVFKFTSRGKGNFCDVKFKGRPSYKVECTTNIATEAYLGGEIITEDEYNKY